MRLVLLEVYTRSILQFGCAIWAPLYLLDSFWDEHPTIKPLLVLHRRYIRSLLGLKARLPNVIVCIVSARVPLKATLIKLVRRYYNRIEDMAANAKGSMDTYDTLT